MGKYFLTILMVTFAFEGIIAQELDFKVSVSSPVVDQADPKIFDKLEKEISNLFNSTRWTEDSYEEHEKIKGQITLTVTTEVNATNFEAELAIISARPVFNSTSTTQLIKYLDRNVVFTYDGIRPIQKSEANYVDNLSSIMTYYAYYILGMDYDSFSPEGGTPYFDKAYEVWTALPQGIQRGDSGWKPDDNTGLNRYALVENARNPSLLAHRNALYDYHIKGIDTMHEDPDKARAVMLSAITQIGETDKGYPRTIMIRMFSDAKELELVDIFKSGTDGEKAKIRRIMNAINPLRGSAYKSL